MITFSKIDKYGQFGNQMFRYTLLYSISQRKGFEIEVDWKLGKKNFNIPIRKPDRKPKNKFISKLQYNESVFSQPDNTDYFGYFQSIKYFSHLRQDLIKIFTPVDPILERINNFIKKNLSPEKKTIACHIRGGDYLDWGFPVPGREYYKDALEVIYKKDGKELKDYNIIIMGNDKKLAKSVFNFIPHAIYSKEEMIIDMFLISKADRAIISASSFAWWGAWLNTKTDKITIAPKYWLNWNIEKPYEKGDVWYPEGMKVDDWIYIKPKNYIKSRLHYKRLSKFLLTKFQLYMYNLQNFLGRENPEA